MSTLEEDIPKEEKRSKRSTDDERKTKKKSSRDADDGGASSRSASSSEVVKKKKKKKSSDKDDASVYSSHTSRERKKKKKLMEASEEERRSILDRLESKGTVASTASSREGSAEEEVSERKKKKKSKHGDESTHRSSKSKKSSTKDDSTSRSKRHSKKEHRHSNSSSKNSSADADSDGDKKPKARSHDKDAKVAAAAPTKRKGSASSSTSDRAMFTVTKGDGGTQWGDESEQQSLEDATEFSSSSVASGFSMPASSRNVVAGAVQVGAVHSKDVPDRIQNMLDRKFHEYDGTRGSAEEKQEEGAESVSAASQVGAHRETNVPSRIQNMLDQKFTEYGQQSQGEMSASSENHPAMSLHEKKVQQFQPTYVSNATTSNVRDKLQGKLQGSFNDEPNLDPEAHRNLAPAASTRFSLFNAGQDKVSVATPTPDVLANIMMDGHDEIGLNSAEKTEARLAAGLCPDCGRTRTHEKIKYGPFQAFRKLEPVTTPGHAYKGYCLFCNNLHDLRRYLHEPYLREQDLDGSLAVPLAAGSKGDDKTSAGGGGGDGGSGLLSIEQEEQEFARRKRRIQICLFLAAVAVIAGGIGLAVTFVGNSNAGTPTVATAAPPTSAPGPLGWHQVGPDISQPIESFGYKVSISGKGNRIAVASPKANTNVGRVDVFEFAESGDWQSVGQPVLGDFEDDLTGFDMDLSGDGKHLVIGYPGNEAGYVRVYYLTKGGEWKQSGSTISGETTGGWFGASVAIVPDGTALVVGAPYDTNENGSEAGRVRVFVLDESSSDWVQLGSDLVGRAALDHFGTSVDLSDDGTKLAVGAPNNDDRWQDGGQVHVFEFLEDKQDWKESLKQLKILGDEEGHEFGSSMSLSGFGDIVISSSLIASNDAGTVGGGDPRAVYIAYVDDVGEELGYGFPEIPGTLGLGYGCDIDYDGTKVILSTLNLESGVSGKAMMYDITGKANWYIYSDEYGGEKLGPEEWLGDGPSVTLSEYGDFFGIGYESIVVDAKTKESAPVVRVYGYGHGPADVEEEEQVEVVDGEGKQEEPESTR